MKIVVPVGSAVVEAVNRIGLKIDREMLRSDVVVSQEPDRSRITSWRVGSAHIRARAADALGPWRVN